MIHVMIASEADVKELIWSLKRINWLWNILCWWYDKTRVRVASYESGVTSCELKSMSWNSKVWVQLHELQVQLHELQVQIHELRVQIRELRFQIHKFKFTSYEFKYTR